MPRLNAPARLAAIVLALVAPLLVGISPAHADPQPTPITLVFYPDHVEDTTLRMTGLVQNGPATGTFTYTDADGNVVGTNEALPGGGTYPISVPKPAGPTSFTVHFASDDPDNWSDVTLTRDWTPQAFRTVTATQQPTIIKLGGLLPTLTLTLAVKFTYADGTPVPNMKIYNYMLCDPGPNRYCGLHVPLCEATSGPDGLATCKGSGTVGALVSILGGNVVQTIASDNAVPRRNLTIEWTGSSYPIIG